MLHRIGSLVYGIGRATTYLLGGLVLAGLLLGPVSIGLAAVGDPLKLGRANDAVTKATSVVATLAGPVLRLTNQGVGPALDLRVQNNAPPLKVNSTSKVVSLNADQLDGQDAATFMPVATYQKSMSTSGPGTPNAPNGALLTCDSGDRLLSGGISSVDEGTFVMENLPGSDGHWQVAWINDDTADEIGIAVLCANVP